MPVERVNISSRMAGYRVHNTKHIYRYSKGNRKGRDLAYKKALKMLRAIEVSKHLK